jgi:hypothetical protein
LRAGRYGDNFSLRYTESTQRAEPPRPAQFHWHPPVGSKTTRTHSCRRSRCGKCPQRSNQPQLDEPLLPHDSQIERMEDVVALRVDRDGRSDAAGAR